MGSGPRKSRAPSAARGATRARVRRIGWGGGGGRPSRPPPTSFGCGGAVLRRPRRAQKGVPPGPLAKEIALLQRTERFSRSFVEALRKLDADALARAIGEESPGQPLLSASVLEGVAARRTTVLAAIDKKIAAHGEAAVLVF